MAMQPDREGQTALFHAVEGGHAECAEYLLTIGATVGQLNNERRRCVHSPEWACPCVLSPGLFPVPIIG